MKLELLALLLADEQTAVAKIGTRSGSEMVPMFQVPFPLEGLTADTVLATVAEFQAKVDTLKSIHDACQPKLVTVSGVLPPNVQQGKFGSH